MKSHKRIVKIVAKNHGLDSDELLIILWDFPRKKFDYLDSQNNVIKQKDYRLVKKIIKSKFEIVEKTEKISKIVPRVEFIYREYNFSLIGVKKVDLGAYMNKDEILMIYQELVLDFDKFKDPIQPSGLKEEALLESAIFHPQTSYEKQAKYPTVESSAAALMYSLSQNHAFHNGNKRTAMVSMLIFLDKHNMCITSNEDDLFKISLELADHRLVDDKYLCADAEIFALSKWIHSNCKTMKKGERPITLKKFKQILTHFDCTFLNNGKVQRVVKTSFLSISRTKKLVSRNAIGDTVSDGKEVNKSLIKSIREDLNLDVDHAIDSDIFYEKSVFTSSDFINRYRSLLKRLSKV